MRRRYLAGILVCIVVLIVATAMSTAAYFGARDAKERNSDERADRIIDSCRRTNDTNRGVLAFIAATLDTKPLHAIPSGNSDVDHVIAAIIEQVNANQETRNEVIADAQRHYFPLRNCTTGALLPPPAT